MPFRPRWMVSQPSTTVTEDKFFGFLWYQSRCHQRPRGRPGQCKPVEEQFSKDDYESVISNIDWILDKLFGYSVLNQYRSAILDLHAQQWDGGCNNIPKKVFMSGRVKRLLKTVKMRKTQIAKRNFDEKLPVNSRHTLLLKIYQDLKIFSFKIIRYHPFIQWHLYVIDIVF